MINQTTKRRAWTRLRVVLVTLSLVLVGAVGTVTMAGVASADVTPILSGSSWLSGSGVNVCASSTDTTCGGQTHVGGYSGNWWQCVELAQRLYKTEGWFTGIFPGVSVATDIYNTAAAPGNTNGFTRQANGSVSSVVPGDMLVFAGGVGAAGHVGIVSTVTDNGNGTKTLSVVNQNAYEVSSNVTWTVSTGNVSKYSYMDGHSTDTTFSVMGIVHVAGNTNGGGNLLPPSGASPIENGGFNAGTSHWATSGTANLAYYTAASGTGTNP